MILLFILHFGYYDCFKLGEMRNSSGLPQKVLKKNLHKRGVFLVPTKAK